MIENRLAGMAFPSLPGHFRFLSNNGVGLIVTLTEESLKIDGRNPELAEASTSLASLHLPIVGAQ